MTADKTWKWVPNCSLGPFKLGNAISTYVERYGARQKNELDRSPAESSDTYSLPRSNAFLCAEGDLLVSVTAYAGVTYKDTELIGKSIENVEELLGSKADEIGDPVLYDDGDIQTPHDFFDYGLQVWTSDDKVVSVTCLTYQDCRD